MNFKNKRTVSHVLEARSVQEAERYLGDDRVHLAILDLRMENDNDDKDISGLMLAKHTAYRAVPKIILTGFPSYEAVREALGSNLTGMPAAVDFLAKQEGPEAMLQAVETAFARNVRINWDLRITTNERYPLTLPHLATLIEPGFGGERLLHRAGELEDVLRKLFYEKRQIRLDRLLWQREGRVALSVLAFQDGTVPTSFVVVCSQSAEMAEETQRYATFAPKVMEGAGTVQSAHAETIHFTANAYALAGADLEKTQTLAELYRSGPEKVFNTALERLVQQTLTAWHQEKCLREERLTLDALYRERLAWNETQVSRTAFAERVRALVQHIPTLGVAIEHSATTLTVRIYGQSFSYPNPTPVLYGAFDIGQPVLVMNTPGTLTGDNILTDVNGHAWLTDFADVGLAPLLWNFVALEAAMRFDWSDAHDLQALHGMERCLVDNPLSKLDTRDVEPALRKPVRAIQTVRRLAAPMLGTDPLSYHLGLLFQAVHRLRGFNPALPLTASELVRYAHILLAAAMLYGALEKQGKADQTAPEVIGLRIDEANRAVWVGGVRVAVSGHSYDLLYYLYVRAGQLCTRRQLVEEVLEQTYDETDRSQVSRFNTAIRRLREKIEEEPGQPRYLHTEPGIGYRLVRQPETQAWQS